MHIDEEAMQRKALELPVQGVPPELITLLPNDGAYDKLHMQKVATPVEAMKGGLVEVAASCQDVRPNVVVMKYPPKGGSSAVLRKEQNQQQNRRDALHMDFRRHDRARHVSD